MSSRTVSAVTMEADQSYAGLESLVAQRIAALTGPLFTTNASGLWEAYLAGIPAEYRQHYTCSACRRFIERYGGLVTIDERGLTGSPLWDAEGVPEFFLASVAAMRRLAMAAKVTGVFLASEHIWGNPVTGEWTHLSGKPAKIFYPHTKTASQAMAEKLEDYKTLTLALSEPTCSEEVLTQAVRVLEADALDRSEKTLGNAKWLLALRRHVSTSKRRANVIWRAVATAPPGWCHVRSTMIATLLDDIVQGLDYETISRRWAQKMHPLQYQRPTTISDGTIAQANKLVGKLGAAGALARRYARQEDILAWLWRPKAVEPKPATGEIFDHLKIGGKVKELELPPVTMTLAKFRNEVLPEAMAIAVQMPSRPASFYGLVTATNPDATPILQWDGLDGLPRNPVSWYFYSAGSFAEHWGLQRGAWVDVAGLCAMPPHWQCPEKFRHVAEAVLFVLPGAEDTRYKGGALFFPESLRSEYHGIRSVMEQYSQKALLTGRESGNANGLAFQQGGADGNYLVKVSTSSGQRTYLLDRWE